MIVANAQGWAAEWTGAIIAILLGGAIISAACRHRLPRGWAWVAFVFLLSAAGAMASARFRTLTTTPTQYVAWLCALLCLFWSVVSAAVASMRRQHSGGPAVPRPAFISLGRLAAVLFGVATTSIQSIVLVMRMIYVGVDIVHGYPWEYVRDYGFGPSGLGSLVLLFLSCAIGLASSGARHLATVQLWTTVLLTFWACLLYPPFQMNASGAFERTTSTLLLLASLSMVLAGAVLIQGWFAYQSRSDAEPPTVSRNETPGFTASCGVLAIVIIVLTCYHLLVPVRIMWGGFRGSTLSVFVSATVAAGGGFLLLARSWSDNLADAALGLASLSLCALAMLAVPSLPASLSERYPMMFNAMIVGLTLATGVWTWLSCVRSPALDEGEPYTTAVQLIPHAQRFAFLSAALALVAGALMTYWPRMHSISGMDHSLGRITAGFAAHLFLVLVMLWCSRRLRRLTYHLLTVLAVVSMAGFMIVRMAPFASQLG